MIDGMVFVVVGAWCLLIGLGKARIFYSDDLRLVG